MVWLIFVALCSPLGYEKTGLGRRVALNLVKWLGKRTLGLGYAVALADLAPLYSIQYHAQRQDDLCGHQKHFSVVHDRLLPCNHRVTNYHQE
jgi:hypothetical protein